MTAHRSRGFGTASVHGPEEADPPAASGSEAGGPAADREHGPHPSRSHQAPIHQTSGFAFPDSESAIAAFEEGGAFVYSRMGNPTVAALERHVAVLEAHPVAGAPIRPDPADLGACFFASGMGAISAVVLGVAAEGRVICQDGIYGTTVAHLRGLRRYGIEVVFVPPGDPAALGEAAASGPSPALVYVETPANPLLQVTDIRAAATAAHDAGALLAVDGTFATPALQRPLAWGADLVVHSTTKFMGGHGVALGGVVTGASGLVSERIRPMRKFFGAAPDPFAAWLTGIGLRTLEVRLERHAANAAVLADALRAERRVASVIHPDPSTLPPGQLAAGGPMVTFETAGGEAEALEVIDRLELASLVPSLGTLDTTVQHPYSMSHGLLPEARRRALGIAPGLVRVSVGLEDPDDIVEDFRRALGSGASASPGAGDPAAARSGDS